MMDFDPSLNHFDLLRRDIASQNATITEGYGRFVFSVLDKDVRQLVAFVFKQDGHQNALEHTDRGHYHALRRAMMAFTSSRAVCSSRSRLRYTADRSFPHLCGTKETILCFIE